MRHLVTAVIATLVVTMTQAPASSSGTTESPVNVATPTVSGDPAYRGRLVADPGEWVPSDGLTYRYQWRREGSPIRGATARHYRPVLADLGRRLSVQVTATDGAHRSGSAVSEPTAPVSRAAFTMVERPSVSGTLRYTRRLTADPGQWSPRRYRVGYRWFRGDRRVRGARGRQHVLDHRDVGQRLRVRVTVRKQGYQPARAWSRPTRAVGHRVPVRRTATYRIETRGRITADLSTFRAQVAETLADPRGWRSAGVAFRRVDRGGHFSVVLAEAGRVPGFHPICSAQWSCRVGRYVVINQTRWQRATPSWNRARKSLRSYRHMVLNHETGHWLGHGHLGCPGRGRPAPIMMQQSKGLDGCRHNPWPLGSERWYR